MLHFHVESKMPMMDCRMRYLTNPKSYIHCLRTPDYGKQRIKLLYFSLNTAQTRTVPRSK